MTTTSPDDTEKITLRDYFDAKFIHLTDHVDQKFNALRDHVDTRFDAKDREAALRYPNREEYAKLEAKVGRLENVDSELRGKASKGQNIFSLSIGLSGLLLGSLSLLLKLFRG